jgi:hypothetical protein
VVKAVFAVVRGVMMDVGGSKNADLLDLKLETAYLIFNFQRFE